MCVSLEAERKPTSGDAPHIYVALTLGVFKPLSTWRCGAGGARYIAVVLTDTLSMPAGVRLTMVQLSDIILSSFAIYSKY